MLKINLRSGLTLTVDLADAEQRRLWEERQGAAVFQREVTGIAIHEAGMLHTMPVPLRFERASFTAERILRDGECVGERVACHADEVVVTLSVYRDGPLRPGMTRVDVRRIGRPRYQRPGRAPQQALQGRCP